tara:strand:+ start:1347 stop:1727 length:381 start_codon:yes stop_codon:yes gene_type:complete
MLEVFIWYFLGIVSYMLVSKLINYGTALRTYNEVIVSILQLLYVIDKGIEDANNIKYKILEDSGTSPEEVDETREEDRLSLDLWKELMIQSLIMMVPPKYRSSVRFKNWRQAVKLLESKYKQQKDL